MKNASFALALVFVLLSVGCATIPEQTNTYAIAQVNTVAKSDAVEGLDPVDSAEYPMLYYIGPGIRRLNHELY